MKTPDEAAFEIANSLLRQRDSAAQGNASLPDRFVISAFIAARDAEHAARLAGVERERIRLFDLGVQTDDVIRVILYGAEWGYGRTHEQRMADIEKLKSRAESAEAALADARAALDELTSTASPALSPARPPEPPVTCATCGGGGFWNDPLTQVVRRCPACARPAAGGA